jgi:hypothetical protein
LARSFELPLAPIGLRLISIMKWVALTEDIIALAMLKKRLWDSGDALINHLCP